MLASREHKQSGHNVSLKGTNNLLVKGENLLEGEVIM